MLRFIPDCFKDQKMYKAVNNYSHALRFVLNCYRTREVYYKALSTYVSAMQFDSEFF